MSDDFFNQSFSPAPSSGNRRRPPPPPPAPRSGGVPRTSINQKSSTSSFNSVGSSGSGGGAAAGGGFYASNSSNNSTTLRGGLSQQAPPRPTGDYYATTSTAPVPTASFYNISSSTAAAPAAPSPYGYNNANTYSPATAPSMQTPSVVPPVTEGEGGWFSSSNPVGSDQSSIYKNPYGASSTDQINDSNTSDAVDLSGPIASNSAPGGAFTGTILNPSTATNSTASTSSTPIPSTPYDPHEFDNEPPLLEELGINFTHIRTKSLAVLLPMKFAKSVQQIDTNMMEDNDMAGPLAFALALGGELLLCGKIHFGYIYGFCLFGCLATTIILNLMAPTTSISIWTVMSILGYSLLPVNFLAGLNIVYRIQLMGSIGMLLAALTILWCATSSTRLFERGCGLRDQRYLVAYPNMLLYSAFVIITIF